MIYLTNYDLICTSRSLFLGGQKDCYIQQRKKKCSLCYSSYKIWQTGILEVADLWLILEITLLNQFSYLEL